MIYFGWIMLEQVLIKYKKRWKSNIKGDSKSGFMLHEKVVRSVRALT